MEFVAMTQTEFELYLRDAEERIATEMAAALDLLPDVARAAAREALAAAFPEGRVDAPDQTVVHLAAGGVRVGWLHFALRPERATPAVYVSDIGVYPEHRGKGLGEAAMRHLEHVVRERGIAVIGLNVFGGNARARRLYQKLGYEPESIILAKRI